MPKPNTADRRALIEQLVEIAMSVLHHDCDPDGKVDEYERDQLTVKFRAALSSWIY